jgi:hypothetical protein
MQFSSAETDRNRGRLTVIESVHKRNQPRRRKRIEAANRGGELEVARAGAKLHTPEASNTLGEVGAEANTSKLAFVVFKAQSKCHERDVLIVTDVFAIDFTWAVSGITYRIATEMTHTHTRISPYRSQR